MSRWWSGRALAAVGRLKIPSRLHRLAFAGELAIVMYHGVVRNPLPVPDWCFVGEDQFAEQMHYLARNTRVLPLDMALQQMRSGKLDYPTVAITFDDGFQSVHDLAFPILRELSLPATVFLTTALVGTSRTIWFCELLQMLSVTNMESLTWRDERYDLCGAAARALASARLQDRLKELDPDALLKALRELQLRLDVSSNDMSEVFAQFRVLDRDSIASMRKSGLVEFGAHTESHSILTRVDQHRAESEIIKSVQRTTELTGAPCHLFAYPNGRKQDYNEASTEALRRVGITSAVTTVPGPNTPTTPELELRRYGVGSEAGLERFQIEVHHLRWHLSRDRY